MTIAGLPLHALVVHLAVILVPLAAIGFITVGWRASWRRQYGLALVLIAIVGAVAAFVAAQSGESLQHSIRDAARAAGVRANLQDHPDDGSRAEIVAAVLAFAAAGWWALDRWRTQLRPPAWAGPAAYALVAVISLAAILTMISAGHSGATLVWKDIGTFAGTRQ